MSVPPSLRSGACAVVLASGPSHGSRPLRSSLAVVFEGRREKVLLVDVVEEFPLERSELLGGRVVLVNAVHLAVADGAGLFDQAVVEEIIHVAVDGGPVDPGDARDVGDVEILVVAPKKGREDARLRGVTEHVDEVGTAGVVVTVGVSLLVSAHTSAVGTKAVKRCANATL